MRDYRYCLLSFDYLEEAEDNRHGDADLPISGLYNWARVLGGARLFPRSQADFEKFDLFHINLTTKNLCLLPTVRKRLPAGARLMMNVDFAIELWNNTFPYPDLMLQELNHADLIFAVEPAMADLLSHALHRHVPCIPHPTDVDGLAALRSNERTQQVLVNLHRYDANFLLPHFATRHLPAPWQTIACGSTQKKNDLLHLYDFIKEACPFDELMKLLATTMLALESYTMHSYGRFTIECAALGVPCVGPEYVASQRVCFPELTFPHNDFTTARKLVERLIGDTELYTRTATLAADRAQQYSFDASRDRILKELEQC